MTTTNDTPIKKHSDHTSKDFIVGERVLYGRTRHVCVVVETTPRRVIIKLLGAPPLRGTVKRVRPYQLHRIKPRAERPDTWWLINALGGSCASCGEPIGRGAPCAFHRVEGLRCALCTEAEGIQARPAKSYRPS